MVILLVNLSYKNCSDKTKNYSLFKLKFIMLGLVGENESIRGRARSEVKGINIRDTNQKKNTIDSAIMFSEKHQQTKSTVMRKRGSSVNNR